MNFLRVVFSFLIALSFSFSASFDERIYELPIGWNLLSTSQSVTNMQEFDKTSVIWKYNNGWEVYSSNSAMMNALTADNFKIITTIESGEGFWALVPNTTDFHFAETNDTSMPIVVVNDFDKSFMSYFFDENTSTLQRLSLTDPNGKIMSVSYDPKGYPLEIVTDDEIIIFSNYTDTSVGLSVMNKDGNVTVEYATHTFDDEMKNFIASISTPIQARTLFATASEKAQMASTVLDYSTKTFSFVKHAGETLEKSGKFTPKDAIKYATKTVIVDYLKAKIKDGSVTLEVIDNVHDMLSDTAGCVSSGGLDCATLVYKTLKHTTDLYVIYEDIKQIEKETEIWVKENEALLKIKKAQYAQRLLLDELQRLKHELERDKDWFVECGDYSQKEVDGVCVPKTCKDDMYGCPSCNTLQELFYNPDGSGYCELKPCLDGEKRDTDGFCVPLNCEEDNVNCPTCSESEQLFYYTDGSGYCDTPVTCNENEKLVGNTCVLKTCEDDNFECTSCASGEILIVTNEDGSGYCESTEGGKASETSSLTPILFPSSLPQMSSCPSGFVQKTTSYYSTVCDNENGNTFTIYLKDIDSVTGALKREEFYTPYYNTDYWTSAQTGYVTYNGNGTFASYEISGLFQNSDGSWMNLDKETYRWYADGTRQQVFIYANKLNTANNKYNNVIEKYENFYDNGKISSRTYYMPYLRSDGFWSSKSYLEETFSNVGGVSYLDTQTFRTLDTSQSELMYKSYVQKTWFTYDTYTSPNELYYGECINNAYNSCLMTEAFTYHINASIRTHSIRAIVQNDDTSHQSLITSSKDYFDSGQLKMEQFYQILQNDDGFYTNVENRRVEYNLDGSLLYDYTYEVIKSQTGYWGSGAIIE